VIASKVISLGVHGGGFTVRPAVYLGELFREYLDLQRAGGAIFNPNLKCGWLTSPDSAAEFVALAENGGWACLIEPAARDAMLTRARAMQDTIDEAERYASSLDARLEGTGLSPFPYQRIGIGYLCTRKAAGLFDEMGLGKTIQAILAARALQETGDAVACSARVVVVCPKVAKGVWARELARWWPAPAVSILQGRGSFRWPESGEIVITNKDILNDDCTVPPDGAILIADEAHAYKNPRAQCTKRFREMSFRVLKTEHGRVWVMTGTPLLNRPDELWNVLEAADLGKEAFGTRAAFSRMSMYGVDAKVPTALRKVSLLRRREEVLPDLPTKIYRDIEAECVQDDEELKTLCDEAWQALLDYCAKRGISLDDALDEVSNFKGGVTFEMMSRVRHRLSMAKIKTLLEVLEEHEDSDDPVVVFSAHRAPIDTLATRGGWGVITGDQTGQRREETVSMFQDGRLRGIAATIQAGGIAITLTRAHEAVFVDLAWTPALNTQAEDRICRIGQTRGVIITRLIADHILDRKVTAALDRKQALITAAVDASARTVANDSAEQIRVLTEAATKQVDVVLTSAPQSIRRGPETDRERWARSGLQLLAADDPDHARVVNGIGFNKIDNEFGHSIALQLHTSGGLTEKQWAAAVQLCRRYQRQIGEMP